MKQHVKMFSGIHDDELTDEINIYLEENNYKIVSAQFEMSSSFPNYKTILVIFEEIKEC